MSKPIKYKLTPNQATDEMLNQARNLLGTEIDEEFFKVMWFVMWNTTPEVEQEPFAKMNVKHGLGHFVWRNPCVLPDGDYSLYTQYHTKPATKTVHEWMSKSKDDPYWQISSVLCTEDEVSSVFRSREYRKTGRSWEEEEV